MARLALRGVGLAVSVGGYVHAQLGHIASAGDSFKGGRATWTVEKVKGRRIEWVKLTADVPWPEETLVAAGLKSPTDRDRDGAEAHAAEG